MGGRSAAAGTVDGLVSRQHPDGSWGSQANPARRIVSTIFAARSLLEGGARDEPALGRSLEFLAGAAVVPGAGSIDGSGGSIDGTRAGVLSCYTGMLARLFIEVGRTEAADPLVRWIVRHQPIAFGGVSYLQPAPGPLWDERLRRRYGGCMAQTTCLLGAVPTMSALVAARRAGMQVEVRRQLDATRRLLIDRRVMFGRTGSVMPLAGRTAKDPEGVRWLLPAFPLNYVIDLIELVQLAVDVDVPAEAMSEALDLIRSWRLPDGGWPMLGRRELADVYRPEPVDRRRRSEVITRRVKALGPLLD